MATQCKRDWLCPFLSARSMHINNTPSENRLTCGLGLWWLCKVQLALCLHNLSDTTARPPMLSVDSSAAESVMQFVLRNSDLQRDVKTLCSLLCVSQAIATSVHASCAGCLALEVGNFWQADPRDLQKLLWLSKHAVLLRQLKHCSDPQFDTGSGLAAALHAAAFMPLGLRLQLLQTSSIAVLQAAALSSSLTQLQLCLPSNTLGCTDWSGQNVPQEQRQHALTAITGVPVCCTLCAADPSSCHGFNSSSCRRHCVCHIPCLIQ